MKTPLSTNPSLQIGSNWAITAAHCVMEWEARDTEEEEEEEEEDVEEVVPASDLTFWLGVGDRRRLTPRARCTTLLATPLPRKVTVTKILVHENYNSTSHEHDLALLRLSECPPGPACAGGRVDLVAYPPACLPDQDTTYEGEQATVAGGAHQLVLYWSQAGAPRSSRPCSPRTPCRPWRWRW